MGVVMADDIDLYGSEEEEIEGAPPVVSRAELHTRRMSEMLTINRYLYHQVQQLEHMLLRAPDLEALLEILLVSMPRHFSFRVAELWLYDPEEVLSHLIVGVHRYGQSLRLLDDVFPIQDLYELEPDVMLIDATDSRMFDVLTSEQGIDAALLMPLTDGGRMIGSLHMGLQDDFLNLGREEQDLLAHLAAMIAACFKSGVSRQQISQITLLDPLTEISNLRGFERDIAREIARSRRAESPLTVLMMEIDGFDDLFEHYGERRGNFVVRKVAERLSSDLRQTDFLARLERPRFAILLPNSGEIVAQEVAQRMRRDIEEFPIDDGRGAVLQVCLSIGMVTWEPQQYPAVDMPRLAKQMEAVGNAGLETAKSRGGNCVAQARLSTMMV
ncbi:MAG: sensor domain-containing diguanylate cyclase [Halioglobus sp.]|nr:sensor domain-containing diguanylate cyclase [Halioglobus sp.]